MKKILKIILILIFNLSILKANEIKKYSDFDVVINYEENTELNKVLKKEFYKIYHKKIDRTLFLYDDENNLKFIVHFFKDKFIKSYEVKEKNIIDKNFLLTGKNK